MPPIVVPWSDRVAIIGKTGSGKTFFAQHLLAPIPRLVVLDPKGTLGGPEWKLEPWSRAGLQRLQEGKRARLRVPWPTETAGDWRPFLADVFALRNVTCYIDEMYGVVDPGAKPPPELQALYTRGRELGIGVWACTQRPVSVPLVMLSEAEELFQFRLTMADDLKRTAAFMGSGELLTIPYSDPYGFWAYSVHWPAPQYVRQLVVPKGK